MFHRSARLALSVVALVVASILVASARADVTISVAPSLVEVAATPGGEGGQDLVVYNDGSDPFQVVASVEQSRRGSSDSSAVSWLKVEPQAFDVAPGQQQTVRVTIVVPRELASGGRYAVVTFATRGKPSAGSSVGVAGQVGVPFLISVSGQGALTKQANLDWIEPVLETDGRVGFRAWLANRGNLHVISQGKVEVRREDGSLAGRLDFPETTATLPQTDRLLTADGTLPLEEDVSYLARTTIEYGGDAPATAEIRFKAKAALSLVSLAARENLDKGPTLQLSLRNDGELGVAPRVRFAVRNGEGKVIGTPSPPQPPLVRPGELVQVEAVYPGRLSTGDYVLVARVEYGSATPIQREVSFRIGNPVPTPNPDWGEAPERAKEPVQTAAGFPWWLIAIPVALLLVGVGFARLPVFVRFRRRLRRAIDTLREDE